VGVFGSEDANLASIQNNRGRAEALRQLNEFRNDTQFRTPNRVRFNASMALQTKRTIKKLVDRELR
jgi:hypothetical protein